jgi:acetylornithine deacetylase/succinyl-diaminopimelate desuccinylase-like protein
MLPNAQKEIKLSYKAYNDEGNPTGIGGDDKCGVFACLSLLKELPNLKAAFFVAEETGCNGSLKANKNFFKNVGYGIQFDAPENWMITEECFSCINFSIGYYNYHTKNEYVVVEDVFNGADMGRRMIESLGNKLHYKKSVQNRYGRI